MAALPTLADFRWTFSVRGGEDWGRDLLEKFGLELGFGEIAGSLLSWDVVDELPSTRRTYKGGVRVLGAKRKKYNNQPCSELTVSYALFDKAGKLVAFSNDFQEVRPRSSTVSFRSKQGGLVLDRRQLAELVTPPAPAGSARWLHADGIGAVAFDGKHRVVTFGSNDRTIRIWRDDGSVEATIPTKQNLDLVEVAFSPSNAWCAVLTWQGTLLRWSLVDHSIAKLAVPAKGHSLQRVAISPDGKAIAGFLDDLLFRCAADGTKLIKLRQRALAGDWPEETSALAFSPDSSALVVRCDDGLRIYDRALVRTASYPAPGTFATWRAEGIWFATDGRLCLLDPKTLKLERSVELPEGKVVASAGPYILVVGKATHVVALDKGRRSRTLQPPKGAEHPIAISPGGRVAFVVGARVVVDPS